MAKLKNGEQLIGVICLIVVLIHITSAVDTVSFNISTSILPNRNEDTLSFNISTNIRPSRESNEDYGFDTPSSNILSSEDGMQHILKDNGMLQLVLHELAVNLIEKLQAEEDTQLHESQAQIIQDDILDFYNKIIGHPALNNYRIVFAQTKPNFRRMLPPSIINAEEEKNKRTKRSGHLKEICNSVSSWKEMETGVTRTQKQVTLLEDQFFYVTECTNPSKPCENISPLYASKCWQKSSWNIAYVWSKSSSRYVWDWIAVNTCCSCAAAKEP